MTPAKDLNIGVNMQFPSFNEWKQGEIANALLHSVYTVMKKANDNDPGRSSWQSEPFQKHAAKAFLHSMAAHENINSIDDKPSRGGAAPTMLPHWMHALTRYAFIAALKCGFVPEGKVIDLREDDVKGE